MNAPRRYPVLEQAASIEQSHTTRVQELEDACASDVASALAPLKKIIDDYPASDFVKQGLKRLVCRESLPAVSALVLPALKKYADGVYESDEKACEALAALKPELARAEGEAMMAAAKVMMDKGDMKLQQSFARLAGFSSIKANEEIFGLDASLSTIWTLLNDPRRPAQPLDLVVEWQSLLARFDREGTVDKARKLADGKA
jgi:hypothetical protein